MKPRVKYDGKIDSLIIDAGKSVKIEVSSSVEDCLVGDFGCSERKDVVGVELLGAAKLLGQFSAGTGWGLAVSDPKESASAMSPLKAEYSADTDILTVSAGRTVELSQQIAAGFFAYLGYAREGRSKNYSVVGFELHNASECLAPWFKLNRALLSGPDSQSD